MDDVNAAAVQALLAQDAAEDEAAGAHVIDDDEDEHEEEEEEEEDESDEHESQPGRGVARKRDDDPEWTDEEGDGKRQGKKPKEDKDSKDNH